jgi:pilus assembly protein Flp/PilA
MLTGQQLQNIKKENIMEKLVNFFRDESGASAMEYGLLAALISVVIIIAVRSVGTNLQATFQAVAAQLPT